MKSGVGRAGTGPADWPLIFSRWDGVLRQSADLCRNEVHWDGRLVRWPIPQLIVVLRDAGRWYERFGGERGGVDADSLGQRDTECGP
jgi:hypothetical protein